MREYRAIVTRFRVFVVFSFNGGRQVIKPDETWSKLRGFPGLSIPPQKLPEQDAGEGLVAPNLAQPPMEDLFLYLFGGFHNRDTSKWMVFARDNPIKMDDLGRKPSFASIRETCGTYHPPKYEFWWGTWSELWMDKTQLQNVIGKIHVSIPDFQVFFNFRCIVFCSAYLDLFSDSNHLVFCVL